MFKFHDFPGFPSPVPTLIYTKAIQTKKQYHHKSMILDSIDKYVELT